MKTWWASHKTFPCSVWGSAMVEEGHKDRAPHFERGASSMRGSLSDRVTAFLSQDVGHSRSSKFCTKAKFPLSPLLLALPMVRIFPFSLPSSLSIGGRAFPWPVVSDLIFEIDLCLRAPFFAKSVRRSELVLARHAESRKLHPWKWPLENYSRLLGP